MGETKLKLTKNQGSFTIKDIVIDSNEYVLYCELKKQQVDNKVLGKGESSVMALAFYNGKCMCSNNMSEISRYIEQYNLTNITIADILCISYEQHITSFDETKKLWDRMYNQQRYLPCSSFENYYKHLHEKQKMI